PRRTVHRALHPPGPDLLAGERQERRQEAVEGGQRSVERRTGRRGAGALALVRAALHEREVVVAEAPEEVLGALEGAGPVEVLERRGGLVDELCQRGEHRTVERLGDVLRGRGRAALAERQRELRRVEQLDREAAPD